MLLKVIENRIEQCYAAHVFNVVNNTEQIVEPESSLQPGVTMLNNIVDNIEQYGQQNIVQSCFQQLVIFCRVERNLSRDVILCQ